MAVKCLGKSIEQERGIMLQRYQRVQLPMQDGLLFVEKVEAALPKISPIPDILKTLFPSSGNLLLCTKSEYFSLLSYSIEQGKLLSSMNHQQIKDKREIC